MSNKKINFLLTLSVFSIPIASYLQAAEFNVTSAADDGESSLRSAITELNKSADAQNKIRINIPQAAPIQLSSDLPVIKKEVTISAESPNQVIDGQGKHRLITAKASISVENCVLKGGLAKGGDGGAGGYLPSGTSTGGGGGGWNGSRRCHLFGSRKDFKASKRVACG
jgi:hypothetical protein